MHQDENKLFLADLSSLTDLSETNLPEEVWTYDVVQEDEGKLFVVEENRLDEDRKRLRRQLKKGIALFRDRGFQENTSQTKSTSNDIDHGNGKKRVRESTKEGSASPLSSGKKAKQETR